MSCNNNLVRTENLEKVECLFRRYGQPTSEFANKCAEDIAGKYDLYIHSTAD